MSGKVYGEPFAVLPKSVLYADVSSHAKVLYGVFVMHADEDGRAYPGRKRLAELMHVSEETVKRAKGELVEAKLIECHERYDDAGRRTTDDVFLTHARVTRDPRVRVTRDPTELKPERSNPTTYEVGSGVTSRDGSKTAPGPIPTCDHCKATGTLLLRVGATWNPRTDEETPGLVLCPTCYDHAAIPT